MLRVKGKMKKCIVGGVAGLLAVVIAAGAVLSSTQTALAANPTLPGVEEIIYNNSNKNTFVILEVVPDKTEASLGLFIGGEEPVDDSAKSIKDMPGAEERERRFGQVTADEKIAALGIGDAVGYDIYGEVAPPVPEGVTPNTVAIRGEFVEVDDKTGDYDMSQGENLFKRITIREENEAEAEDVLTLDVINADRTIVLYRKHMSFYAQGAGDSVYGIGLKKVTPNLKDPDTPERDLLPYELDASNLDGDYLKDVYNNQFFVAEEIKNPNQDDNGLNDNDMIFEVVKPEEGAVATADLQFVCLYDNENRYQFDENKKYVKVEEADGDYIEDDQTYYYVSNVFKVGGNAEPGLVAEETFVAVDRPTNGFKEPVKPSQDPEKPADYVYIDNVFYLLKSFKDQIVYVGDGGAYRFRTDYALDPVTTATFSGGFTNEEWFKKYVFDLTTAAEFEKMSIDVVTMTMEEITAAYNAGNDILADVGMIYFTGTLDPEESDIYTTTYADDNPETEEVEGLSANAAEYLFDAISGGVPTVVNRSMYAYADDDIDNGNGILVRTLAACLMQKNLGNINGTNNFATLDLDTLEDTMVQPLADGTLTYVNGHIYVHDDWDKNKGVNVLYDGFYETEFTDAQIAGNANNPGFEELIEEIKEENFYLELAGEEGRIKEEATVATAIRHILNSGGKRNVTKTSLHVLDLEPYDFEEYYKSKEKYDDEILDVYEDIKVRGRDEGITVDYIKSDSICIANGRLEPETWIINNIAPNLDKGQVKVDILGTKEFIGKLDDLNETYDLIYLGMDTSIMNTNIENQKGEDLTFNYNNKGDNDKITKTDKTTYNDPNMNGLVYAHVGDSLPVKNLGDRIDGIYRMSGNDITFDKLRELREYIEAGYAMIISDEFLDVENGKLVVDTDKIDVSSNMYRLIHDVVLAEDDGKYLYYGKNVNSKANLEGGANVVKTREIFSRYLGISKLDLDPVELPTAWNQENGDQEYLTPDANGVYYLNYTIKLTNDAIAGVDDTTYDCRLYVDTDADGRYEEPERLTGLSISGSDGKLRSVDNNGYFKLTPNDTYTISRELPEGYTGFISWKLLFNQNGLTYDYEIQDEERSMVRSSIIGYSAVPAPQDQKPTIQILQIVTQDGTNNLDLASNEMRTLYADVDDFTINITQITSQNYIRKQGAFNAGDTYIEFLNRFDMVVLGFIDVFRMGGGVGTDEVDGHKVTEDDVEAAVLAIREYTLSGKSVMFTHDLNSFRVDYDLANNNLTDAQVVDGRSWGWYANRLLRDVQGMDRYGWINEENKNANHAIKVPDDDKYKYKSEYDYAKLKDKPVETVGLSNPTVLNDGNKQDYNNYRVDYIGENARRASLLGFPHTQYNDGQGNGSWVTQINTGQITEYPYKIAETFEATHSHAQYMQLNMDTNSRDENNNDDIVVWYALGDVPQWDDSIFGASWNDVRNNFFIYNKGNVTYTGSGDTRVNNDMERKLFVNTLVAAYKSGVRAPRATFKESEWKESASIDTLYVPYDSRMNIDDNPEVVEGAYLSEQLEVYFYTANVDLKQSSEKINAKYYTDCPEGKQPDLTIDGKNYKEVVPVENTIYRCVETDGNLTSYAADPNLLDNNTMYAVSFDYGDVNIGNTGGVQNKHTTNIYVRLGYDELKGGVVDQIPTESIAKLHVVCTQLFELR